MSRRWWSDHQLREANALIDAEIARAKLADLIDDCDDGHILWLLGIVRAALCEPPGRGQGVQS